MKRFAARLYWCVVLVILLFFSGCTSFRDTVKDFSEVMNERNISTCAKWNAYLRGRDIAGGQVDAITSTGQAEIDQCTEYFRGR